MGSRSASLGYASSTLSDGWALFNNMAGLSKNKITSSSFSYALNPSLPGADRIAASLLVPLPLGVMGAGVFRFGDALYNEQIISTGYANQFGLASLGIKLNYVQYRAEGFATRSALSINFGGIAELTPKFSVGAYITNLNQPKLSAYDDEQLPAKLVSGVQFHPDNNLILLLEVEKDLRYKPTIKGGVEFELYRKIKFRTGFNLYPNSIHGGIGYQSSRLHVDYAIQYNTVVLATYQISSSYQFAKRTNKK